MMVGMIVYTIMSGSEISSDQHVSVVVFNVFVSFILVSMIGATAWVSTEW